MCLGNPRKGDLYAMLPFPIAGTWRVVMQTRYHGNGDVLDEQNRGELLTMSFRVVVKRKPASEAALPVDDGLGLLKRGICRFEGDDIIDEGNYRCG
jgi:hypothetical protein